MKKIIDWILNRWVPGRVRYPYDRVSEDTGGVCRMRARTKQMEYRLSLKHEIQWRPLHEFWRSYFKADY